MCSQPMLMNFICVWLSPHERDLHRPRTSKKIFPYSTILHHFTRRQDIPRRIILPLIVLNGYTNLITNFDQHRLLCINYIETSGTCQTGCDAWEGILGDEAEKKDEDCYHGDEDASRDPQSVETGSHAKRRNSTHIIPFNDRRGYAQ